MKIPGVVALGGWSRMELPSLRGAESGRGLTKVKMAIALKGLAEKDV